jgi:hypothetical protein
MRKFLAAIILSMPLIAGAQSWGVAGSFDISTHKVAVVAVNQTATIRANVFKVKNLNTYWINFAGTEIQATSSQSLTGGTGVEFGYSLGSSVFADLWGGLAFGGEMVPHGVVGAGLTIKVN